MHLATAFCADADRLHPRSPPLGLNQAERDATTHFARLLCADLAERPAADHGTPLLLLVGLPDNLEDASARLVPAGAAAARPLVGEVAVALVPLGVPGCPAKRKALALRLASAGAAAWRQHRQVERLGLLAV